MLKINHDTLELDGEIIADFRPGFALYRRDDLRDSHAYSIDDITEAWEQGEQSGREWQHDITKEEMRSDINAALDRALDDIFDELGIADDIAAKIICAIDDAVKGA